MGRRHTITFQPEGLRTELRDDENVLTACRRCGIHIESLCGGRGRCGKCLIMVKGGEATAPTPFEMETLSEAEMEGGVRLACQTYPAADLTVNVLASPRPTGSKILTWGLELPVKVDPCVRTALKELRRPTLKDQRSDADRLKKAFRSSSIDIRLLRVLPSLLRKYDWKVAVTTYRGEIIDVREENGSAAYGAAVDVGTTTVVVYLIDLTSGAVAAVESDYNAQIPYGEDVISRITYISRERDGLAVLQRLVIETLNKLLSRAAKEAKIEKGLIYEIVCAGNTIMMSILLGIDPSFIATAPYVPPVTSGIPVRGRELGIEMSPGGYLRTVPAISGYVGADVVSDILVSGMHRKEAYSLLIDIGTNGEVVLGNRRAMLSASCAAGPALEGAEITFGMRAMTGAIEKVAINPQSKEVFYETIGEARPRGICGSGLVDTLAALTIAGIVDPSGKMKAEKQYRQESAQAQFVIVKAADTEIGKDIAITQKDIRNLQLAKAAIFTGCSLLMKKAHVKRDKLKNLFVAGAFGNYIDPLSAMVIGMFPDLPLSKIKSIGNGAGFGARLALLSRKKSAEEESIVRKMRYVELSAERDFQQEFLKALDLPHGDRSLFPTATRIIESRGRIRPRMR